MCTKKWSIQRQGNAFFHTGHIPHQVCKAMPNRILPTKDMVKPHHTDLKRGLQTLEQLLQLSPAAANLHD